MTLKKHKGFDREKKIHRVIKEHDQVAKHKKRSACDLPMQLPTSKVIDKRLIIGSSVFGVGWGMAGFCPAPALVSAASGQLSAIIFSLAMLTGFYVFAWLEKR